MSKLNARVQTAADEKAGQPHHSAEASTPNICLVSEQRASQLAAHEPSKGQTVLARQRSGNNETERRNRLRKPMPPPTGTARSPRRERSYRRFKLRYPVRLQFRSGERISEVDAITQDASIGGLLLECPVLLAEHTSLSFVIRLTGPTLHLIELAGDGEVVRVERGGTEGEFRVAIECKNPIIPLNDYLPTVSS